MPPASRLEPIAEGDHEGSEEARAREGHGAFAATRTADGAGPSGSGSLKGEGAGDGHGRPRSDGASASTSGPSSSSPKWRRRRVEEPEEEDNIFKKALMEDDAEEYQEYVPVKRRRALEQQKIASALKRGLGLGASERGADDARLSDDEEGGDHAQQGPDARPSLLVKATQLKKEAPKLSEAELVVQTEKEMLERLSERKELMSVKELAKGIHYTEPMVTGMRTRCSLVGFVAGLYCNSSLVPGLLSCCSLVAPSLVPLRNLSHACVLESSLPALSGVSPFYAAGWKALSEICHMPVFWKAEV